MIYSYAPKIPERPSAEGFYCPARPRAPAREAQRDFPCPHESSCTSCNLLGQKALAGFLRTSYPRSRSANSAKNRLGVCKTPILLRKTALLAAYPYPSLKIPAGEAQRDFPVLPGHGPRSAPQRRDFIAPRGHGPRPRAYGLYTTPSSAVHRRVPCFSKSAKSSSFSFLQRPAFAPS